MALVMLSACFQEPTEQDAGTSGARKPSEPAREQQAAAREDCRNEVAAGRLGVAQQLQPLRVDAELIGVLVNPKRPGVESQSKELQAAAEKINLKLEFQKAATEREIESAFQAFASLHVDALLVTADPLFNNRRAQVLSLAARQSLPAIYQWREFVKDGGLMSYGPSITEAYRQAGINAGLMLKGTNPADIPVVQPTRFQLTINQMTANRLELALSAALLSLADEVIE